MSATISLTFGTLSLNSTNNITISKISEKSAKPVQTTDIPVTDGAIAETARLGPKTINVEGDIAGTSYDDLRTNLDALHKGLLNGLQKLTKDNERYIYCQLKDFSFAYDHLTRRATWSASFVAHFPFWLSEAVTTDNRAPASGVAYQVTNAGNAPTRLKLQFIPIISMDDICKFEIGSEDTLQFRGNVAPGNTLEIDNRYDTDDFEVLNNGIDAHINFEGDFPFLEAGVNTVEFTGAASTDIIMTWRSCWY